AGSPAARIVLRASVDADCATRLDLGDSGPGFTQEALGSALLPFYTTKDKGSGMGLALCREIVHAHGGSLSLSNREQGGAVVSIALPGKQKPDTSSGRPRATLTLSRV